MGSPPHAWGILQLEQGIYVILRITPTCVGNTLSNRSALQIRQDHPHMRGEYYVPSYCFTCFIGSPPHAWGIRSSTECSVGVSGITPTCVGNTLMLVNCESASEDHPHMRGEYHSKRSELFELIGSPPHAWGIL